MCAGDPLEMLAEELTKYVGFQRRYRDPDYTFEQALKGHRRQVLENLRDDGDQMWLLRNSLLEKLAEKRGVQMFGEPELKDILEYRRRQTEDRRQSGQGQMV